jgi:hypothetical protein
MGSSRFGSIAARRVFKGKVMGRWSMLTDCGKERVMVSKK